MRSDCKRMARVRDERWVKHRAAVEIWKLRHYEYYIAQKRRLAARPEYLAHRRDLYRAKRSMRERSDLSTIQNSLNDSETTDENSDRPADSTGGTT